MGSEKKMLDTFQIVGFVLSIAVSVVLIVVKQDTVESVAMGLILAALTQLFDLQIRHTKSEERIMRASALSQLLYGDEWLLRHIREIVNSYITLKDGWFSLFKIRANDAIVECRNVLHSMVEGHMGAEPQSPFSFGTHAFKIAERSIKHAAAIPDISYWKGVYAAKALQSNANVIKRGIAFTRVFIHSPETLREIVGILEKQRDIGIDVYIAFPDDVPKDLREDYMIVDDRAAARLEVAVDGKLKVQRISIDPVEVEQMSKKFDVLLFHARKLESVIDDLK